MNHSNYVRYRLMILSIYTYCCQSNYPCSPHNSHSHIFFIFTKIAHLSFIHSPPLHKTNFLHRTMNNWEWVRKSEREHVGHSTENLGDELINDFSRFILNWMHFVTIEFSYKNARWCPNSGNTTHRLSIRYYLFSIKILSFLGYE